MSSKEPYGFEVRTNSLVTQDSFIVKDLAQSKDIFEIKKKKSLLHPQRFILTDIVNQDTVIAVRSRRLSERFIIKKNGTEKAEFWLKSLQPKSNYEISYNGKIFSSHSRKNVVYTFKDFQEKEYFKLDFDWGSKTEYLVEVQESFDPPIAILISTIMISLLDY